MYYFGAKDFKTKVQRWPSLTVGADLFLSLYRVKADWSVGWSVANVSKGSCARSTVINIRQFQSLPNIKLGQYKQLFYQPKPSQASPDASDRDSDCFQPLFRPT